MNKFLFTQTLKRFSLAVILAVCAMTSAFAQNAGEITLKMENAPLGKVMDAIENQSQYLFLNDGVDVNMIVDVNVTKATISATLGEVFAAKPVSWKIDGVNIYISTRKEDAATVGRKVSGVVTDASGMPLIGAAILVKGTTNGAARMWTVSSHLNWTMTICPARRHCSSFVSVTRPSNSLSEQEEYSMLRCRMTPSFSKAP